MNATLRDEHDGQRTFRNAPGAPGTEPHWTSSAKDGIGTAYILNPKLRGKLRLYARCSPHT